jgi:hypothetical protein
MCIKPPFSSVFDFATMLFHTVFNRTVENFHRPFIIRASSTRMYGAKIAVKQNPLSTFAAVPKSLYLHLRDIISRSRRFAAVR